MLRLRLTQRNLTDSVWHLCPVTQLKTIFAPQIFGGCLDASLLVQIVKKTRVESLWMRMYTKLRARG